jgi:hypothetical protein
MVACATGLAFVTRGDRYGGDGTRLHAAKVGTVWGALPRMAAMLCLSSCPLFGASIATKGGRHEVTLIVVAFEAVRVLQP